MALEQHIAEHALARGVYGSLKTGVDRGVIADADLSGGTASAIASVTPKINKLHVSERPLVPRVIGGLEKADTLTPTYSTDGAAETYGVNISASARQTGRTVNL